MADAPVIFKRTKTKATQRARSARNEDNALPPSGPGAESDDGDTESASALAAKLRKQQKARAKPKAALSFRDEEEVSDRTGVVDRLLMLGAGWAGRRRGFPGEEIEFEQEAYAGQGRLRVRMHLLV